MIIVAIVLAVFALSMESAMLAGMVCDSERWNAWPLNVLLWSLVIFGIPALLVCAAIMLIVNFLVDRRKA